MSNAGAIKAGEAFVKIWASDAEAQKTLNSIQAKVKKFSADVTALGMQMATIGAAISAPFALSARVFAGFADKMSTVKAITGATQAQFQALKEEAKRLGASTSFTAAEAADAMLALGRAGYTTNEILAAVPGTLDLARAGALELGEATTIMADISRSFGLAADEATRVGDALAKTANISNTDIHLIGESMVHVASSANLTGQSLEATSAALAVLANRGIKGEMAGASLARILAELANTNVQATLKDAFNIDTKDAAGNMRNVIDVMRELSAATQGRGNADKLALFRELFDMRGMRGAVVLSENIVEWENLRGVIEKSGGTAKAVAAEMDNNLGGSFRIMMSAIEGVQIALGEATEGSLREWMSSLTETANTVTNFVKANEEFVVGVMKIGAILLGAGAAAVIFGKALGLIAGGITVYSRLATGLKSFHDQATGVAQAEKAMADAGKQAKTATEAQASATKNAVKEQEKYFAAMRKSMDADQAVVKAKADLAAAQQRLSAAMIKENQAISASNAALQRQQQADADADYARYQAKLARMNATANPTAKNQAIADGMKGMSNQADQAAAAARAAYVAETKKLTAAQKESQAATDAVAASKGKLTRSTNAAKDAENQATTAAERLSQASKRAHNASNELAGAQRNLASAAQQSSKALQFASGFIGKIGGPQVMAATGSVAALAGSISMLAGDSDLGKIAGTVATVAGIGMAASTAVTGVLALQNALKTMSATGAIATKALAGLAVAYLAWQGGRAIRHKFTGFDEGGIAEKARKEAAEIKDASESNLDAQMEINAKIIDLRNKESSMGWGFGYFRLAGDDCAALNAEIKALEKELVNLGDENKRAAKQAEISAKQAALATQEAAKQAALAMQEAAKQEKLEAYQKAVKALADAWDAVIKKKDEVAKRRADREGEKEFDSSVETDPYAAKNQADDKLALARQNEQDLLEKLQSMEADRAKLLAAAEPDTEAVKALEIRIAGGLKEYEAAIERTDVWERFCGKADDAVTKIRDDLQKLAEDAKKLDLDYSKKQDDQRFKNLLKTDWISAADEVAAVMARVNADWIKTGLEVSTLIAKADDGDVSAQKALTEALTQRQKLASDISEAESRQDAVASARKDSEKSTQAMNEILHGERKYEAKQSWDKLANSRPDEANMALKDYIENLKQQLQTTAENHQREIGYGDLTQATFYEEQAKEITDKLGELRGLQGQKEERSQVTGEFNARAMEAMLRGGGASNIPQKQLDKLSEIKKTLYGLVLAYQPPTVMAIE